MQDQGEEKYIFPEIVKDEEDIIGMIAYSFYKFEKMNFIKSSEEVSGKKLDKKELIKFQEFKYKEIEKYKKTAQETLEKAIKIANSNRDIEFIESRRKLHLENIKLRETLEKKEKEFTEKETYLKQKEKEVKNKEKEIKNREKYCHIKPNSWLSNFANGVLQGVVATIIWTALVILIIKAMDYDIIKFFIGNK